MPEPRAEKGYVRTGQGQLHCRSWTPSTQTCAPLLCLHAMPYSGLHYATLAPLLADRRQVICPDYPGYGGSDTLPCTPTIPIYATAMLDMIAALELPGPVNVLGFHTGCLVAAEMALQSPMMIGRLVLIDVPFFEPEIRIQRRSAVATPPGYDADPGSVAAAWEMNVSSKLDTLPIDRWAELAGPEGQDPIRLRATPVPHDADPTVALRLEAAGSAMLLLTDLGTPDPDLARRLGAAHLVMLEFNHDEELLRAGFGLVTGVVQ